MRPNHLSFGFFDHGQEFVIFYNFLQTPSLVTRSLNEMFNILRQHLVSNVYFLCCNPAIKIHDSLAYRNMDMSREHISFIFDSRDMLSLHIGFSFVTAAVVCAITERTSVLEPLSETISATYLNLVTVSNCCPFTLSSLSLFVISLVFLG